ncbi:EF-hand domain-containing protein [Pseudoalteromonas sp. N1230-9]|uniref:EF-hand domain-containing protein n=1 Tax=unclassified Pseudoalteromonas TaxID=194690 RepID=UPI001023CAF1|nr:EF-hand domain-containing protein [Pseudoalteromonas sp. CO302Y]RZG10605.1 EF-hand domain-containing protein [Pseudoalteromonas sp. CO133X]WOC27685.1 EF-hand domain-containing protein [Pseudoalteromonas sp. N1230-9]
MNKLTLASTILAALSLSACSASNSLAKIDSDFGSLDNDNDGYISKTEADDDAIWAHFSNIDTNMDEQISPTEFNAYMQLNTGKVAEDSEVSESAFKAEIAKFDPIENDFKSLDNDKNGYISIEEADDDDIANHFGYMDSDKDKRVSRNEFINYITEHGSDVAEDDALDMVKKSS